MKAKKALKKINEALDHSMDKVVMLGENDNKLVELVVGDTDSCANLILNFFDDNPDVRQKVIDEMFTQMVKKFGVEE